MIITRASKGAPLTHAEMDANLNAVAEKTATVLTSTLAVNTDALVVNSNKRVSIGTAADVSANLHVYQSSGTVASFRSDGPDTVRCWRWINSNGAAAGRLMLGALNASPTQVDYASLGGLIVSATAGSHTGAMAFYTVNAGVNDERMRITGPGSVLIGTANSNGTDKLQVNGSIVFKPLASATPANNGELTFEATSNTTVKIKLKGTDGIVRSATLILS